MKLYTAPLSMFGAKVQIAALEKGLAFDCVMVPFDRDDRYEPKHPEVLRVNPKRQVPVLIDDDVELFDSTQIFEYLEDRFPEPALWPAGVAPRARARRLEIESDEVFFPHVIRLFGLQDAMQSEPAIAACAGCAAFYGRLEALLADREFLAGPYSFADIAFYMAQVFAERKGALMTGATPRLLAWRERIGARPPVREVVGAMMRFLASEGRPVPPHLQALVRT
ncbi:glutathione S-transferase family protein [Variovorax saccharolyticus]|uniref:glutathione S-transferase family protein n=1 Tax=Variovorax saccharolyticus TaxID=3053516 RepID=UPI002576AAD3|nr:glutathione S-transferase family protein [Variovorax sp. J31P216]MDM0023039.1 glutathione S-transferase family protein [Variovorax sp. J31P216]